MFGNGSTPQGTPLNLCNDGLALDSGNLLSEFSSSKLSSDPANVTLRCSLVLTLRKLLFISRGFI